MKNKIFKVLRYAIPLIIFFFLAKSIFGQWPTIKEFEWRFKWFYLTASFSLLFLTLIMVIFFWRIILKHFNYELAFSKAFKIIHLSNLGRYVPGKVWQFVGMYFMLEKENIGFAAATSCILWSNLLFNLAGIILGVFAIYYTGFEGLEISLTMLAGFFLIIVVVTQPFIIDSIINFLMRKFNSKEGRFSLSFRQMFLSLLNYMILWVCYGTGFFFLTLSITDVPINNLLIFIGIFSLSHVIGYVSFIAPGGIGVREGVLTYMLSYYLPLPVAGIVAILARLWLTIGELVCVFVGLRVK